MPRNVRNWWIELEVDGRKHKIEAGPRRKDGGFSIRISQRENGTVRSTKTFVVGRVDMLSGSNGRLMLDIWADAGKVNGTRTIVVTDR